MGMGMDAKMDTLLRLIAHDAMEASRDFALLNQMCPRGTSPPSPPPPPSQAAV